MIPLPIDPLLPELISSLRKSPNLVLEAPPGAGKTTRVPRAMLDAGMAQNGDIWVLQPRKLAARMAARRVADELGEKISETIGYQIRFDEQVGPKTRVRFVTEGILTRRLLTDRTLNGVGSVLLDEFHERHLHGDVGLALLRALQRTARPDLKLVVMSATLEASPISKYLSDATTLRSEGRRFEVAIENIPKPDDRPLGIQVAAAVQRLVANGLDGDVLVFLPGSAEIRRAREACESVALRNDLMVVTLHGDLSPAEQDRAVKAADRRKIILSTNVAETSVTIDGVVAVIDSGLARIASHAPWSGMSVLRVTRVSRASAIQRAGRAGRTRPGQCIRLYTKHDFDARPEHETPEIKRLDLAETVLELRAAGIRDLSAFEWFEAPPTGALEAADDLLRRLGAIDRSGVVTSVGKRMLRFPVHPRQARLITEAEDRGIAVAGCTLAALVGEREIRVSASRDERGQSDLVDALERFEDAESEQFAFDRVRALGLEPTAVTAVDRVRAQLSRTSDKRVQAPKSPAEYQDALLKSILAGYPDRVGRRREPTNATGRRGAEIVFAKGGTASLAESSVVRDAEFVVAIDAEERVDARGSQTLVRVASAIEADWLLEMFTDEVTDSTDARWNGSSGRVEVVRRLTYDTLVLEETAVKNPDFSAVARVLADAALSKGIRAFVDRDELDPWLARLDFLRTHGIAMPTFDDETLRDVLITAGNGCWTFDDLRHAGVFGVMRAKLTSAQSRQLDEWAPERLTLAHGRKVKVEYPRDSAPWIESRLQDFFGMTKGPTVAAGKVPVVLHLLAPNHRAVQVTTDLAGFWERHYPAIAKELRRKYPRHKWPDDPIHAPPDIRKER